MISLNKFIFSAACCIFLIGATTAQVEVLESSTINAVELEKSIIQQKTDLTIIRGNNNVVFLSQEGINEINAVVRGDRNNLNLLQVGEGNLYVTSQNGNNNQLTGITTGKYNEVNITQNGNRNIVDQSLIDSDANKFIITQNGSNHTLIHSINDESGKALDIRMTGNGMKIVIESN